MVTTVQDLPVETLSEIFDFFVGSLKSNQVPKDPVLLSSVCAEWRTVVTGMPLMWRHISTPKCRLELVSLMLERSKHCSLVIEIYGKHSNDLNPILSLIAEHAERWQEASFSIPSSCFESLVSIRGRLPLLETLRSFTFSTSFSGFELTPALKDLSIGPLDREVATKAVSYTQLTQLSIDFRDASALLAVLAQTSNLIQLVLIKLSGEGDRGHEFCFPVILPHLSIFNLMMDDFGDPSDILCYITTPILSDLGLRYGVGNVQCATDLITRSACSLESLNLSVDDCDQDLISLLGQLPRIKRLQIHFEDPGLASIDGESPFAELFPKLEEMNMTWEEDEDEDDLPQLTARVF